ncbi:MAG: glycosyltransferase [Bacilli bacterium]|nr:glycosyltransferase [Bacilli bacterium]
MRICIFTDAYPPYINGVSTSTYNLVEIFRSHGHQVLLIAPQGEDGPTKRIGDNIYFKGISLKKFYGYRITKMFDQTVFKQVKDFKPDVIHIQTDFTVGFFGRFVVRRLKNVASIYTYHTAYEDYTYYVTRGMADRMAKKIVRNYSKNTAKNVTEYITPSEKTKEYMRFAGSDAYINVIPTGIDFSIFADDRFDKERAKKFKQNHNIGENDKIFLILGRIAKEKSMDISVQGFHAYRLAHPEISCKLVIVGEGPFRGELQNQVISLKEEQNTVFVGSVEASEVPFYYHLADIYTSASITETQGLTFMEAMASGTIVLARFDTQLTNTIMDGETGFFFNDDESFVEKAHRVFTMSPEQKEEIKSKAYKTVDAYSIEKFYENILRVYKRAVRKKW